MMLMMATINHSPYWYHVFYLLMLLTVFFFKVDSIPPDGVTQTLTACEVGFSNDCTRTYEIEVKNCTTFLVYKLKPLNTCNSAYCFGKILFFLAFE